MKNKVYFLIFFIVFSCIIISEKQFKAPLEELQVALGIGADLIKEDYNDIYNITVNTYVFHNTEDSDHLSHILIKSRTGSGVTFRDASQNRQLTEDKQYIMGQEKVFVVSEDYAKYGIKPYFDFLFRSSLINDKANVAICKGKASDILNFKSEKHTSSIDFVDGMLNIMPNEHFANKENKVVDVYTRITSKYRNTILPYISIEDDKIELKGYALFDEDKLKVIVDSEEGKIINLLRESSGSGIITLFDTTSRPLDLYGRCKRKVTCKKEDDTYNFTINLNLTMNILTNEINNDLMNEMKIKKELEKLVSTQIEDECSKFIKKMQNTYKVDYLDLRRILVAKYGRNLDTDLNNLVCNSKIDVRAKVTIANYGRGDY